MWMGYVSMFVGLLARVFVPWLAVRREDPENAKWDWKYVWPQLLGFAIIILLLPLIVDNLEVLGTIEPQAGWLVGWAAGDLGRKTYKALASEEA